MQPLTGPLCLLQPGFAKKANKAKAKKAKAKAKKAEKAAGGAAAQDVEMDHAMVCWLGWAKAACTTLAIADGILHAVWLANNLWLTTGWQQRRGD